MDISLKDLVLRPKMTASEHAVVASLGREIRALILSEHKLRLALDDGHTLTILDDGQSCCETRYMTSDDDLPYYEGSVLLGVQVSDGPNVEAEYDHHETQFLRITTSRGMFTVVTHNEHNGYYGGFDVVCTHTGVAE